MASRRNNTQVFTLLCKLTMILTEAALLFLTEPAMIVAEEKRQNIEDVVFTIRNAEGFDMIGTRRDAIGIAILSSNTTVFVPNDSAAELQLSFAQAAAPNLQYQLPLSDLKQIINVGIDDTLLKNRTLQIITSDNRCGFTVDDHALQIYPDMFLSNSRLLIHGLNRMLADSSVLCKSAAASLPLLNLTASPAPLRPHLSPAKNGRSPSATCAQSLTPAASRSFDIGSPFTAPPLPDLSPPRSPSPQASTPAAPPSFDTGSPSTAPPLPDFSPAPTPAMDSPTPKDIMHLAMWRATLIVVAVVVFAFLLMQCAISRCGTSTQS